MKRFKMEYWEDLQKTIEKWLFVTIGIRFLLGMIAISFLCYAGAIWAYFALIAKQNIFTEPVTPVYLNPVHIIVMCSFVFLIFLDKKRKY